MGADVAHAFMSWMHEERFPLDFGKTNVVLIPKCKPSSSMKDLSSISLCNVIYKILAKVLCNRLKSVLPWLVDSA